MQIHEAKICKSLNCKDRIVFVCRFAFDNDTPLHKQIDSQRIAHDNALVDYRDMNLLFDLKTSLCQFVGKRILIH